MWAAVAVVAAAYVYRSAIRGWDFRPSGFDLVMLAVFVVLVAARIGLGRSLSRDHSGDEAPARGEAEREDAGDGPGDGREDGARG